MNTMNKSDQCQNKTKKALIGFNFPEIHCANATLRYKESCYSISCLNRMFNGPFNIIMQALLGIITLPWKPASKQSFLSSIAFQQVWHQGNNYTLRLGASIITYPCPKSSACSADPFRWKVSLEPYNTNAHFITRTMQAVRILKKNCSV